MAASAILPAGIADGSVVAAGTSAGLVSDAAVSVASVLAGAVVSVVVASAGLPVDWQPAIPIKMAVVSTDQEKGFRFKKNMVYTDFLGKVRQRPLNLENNKD